jgi:hypothetical protein
MGIPDVGPDGLRRPVILRVVMVAAVAAFVASGLLVASRLRPSSHPPGPGQADGAGDDARPGRARELAPVRMARYSPPAVELATRPPVATADDPLAEPVRGARAALEGVLEELSGSGEARGAWLPRARAALDALRANPALTDLVSVATPRCFAGGCAIELGSADADKAHAAVAQIDTAQDFRSWPGGKYRFGPLPAAQGRFTTNVILLRPE